MREDGCDGEAAGALDVHEERAGAGHESLLQGARLEARDAVEICLWRSRSYLEFVLAGFRRWGRVEKVDCENLGEV